MARRLLFVLAKEPRPGSVKTRMCPPLDAGQAARCHAAFLQDLLARMKGSANAHVVLAATPDDDAPALARVAKEGGVELCWQGTGDLGRRIVAMFERASGERCPAVVIGGDSPDLPTGYVEMAFEQAEAGRLALGPCDDGGFYLAGCASVPPMSDWEVPWGGQDVLERTIAGASKCGLHVHLLPWWYDVDDISSLRRLALRMRVARALGHDPGLPSSARVIDELAGEGVPI